MHRQLRQISIARELVAGCMAGFVCQSDQAAHVVSSMRLGDAMVLASDSRTTTQIDVTNTEISA